MSYYQILVLFLLLVLLFIVNNKKEYFTNPDISFELYNIKNEKINNKTWEFSEQELLGKYVKKNDNILQLGGNIGASCICVDKIIDKKNKNICVEPNPKIINVLKKNKEFNKSNFHIIYGAISENQNLKLSDEVAYPNPDDYNFYGSKVLNDGNINIKTYSLHQIQDIKKINVLFADCEGCLEKFIDEYEGFLKQLRLIIYEADQGHLCDYKKIKKILLNNNFKNVEVNGQNYVWTKTCDLPK